jgi:hypothetical protein
MSQQLGRGLVGYWCPMLATTGPRLYDRSGRSNHGTLTNMDAASDWVTAKVRNNAGRVLDFDGTNDRVDCVNANDFTSGGLTISAWVKRANATGAFRAIFGKFGRTGGVTSTEDGYLLRVDSANRLDFAIALNGSSHRFSSTSAIMASTAWLHVAVTARAGDGSAAQMFLNGNQVAATWTVLTGNITLDDNPYRQTIGCIGPFDGSYLQFFQGQIAEVANWSRAILPSEINTLYRLGPGWFGKRASRFAGLAEQAAGGFKAYWARRQSQLIGGGL